MSIVLLKIALLLFSHFGAGSDIRTNYFNFLILGKSRFPPKKVLLHRLLLKISIRNSQRTWQRVKMKGNRWNFQKCGSLLNIYFLRRLWKGKGVIFSFEQDLLTFSYPQVHIRVVVGFIKNVFFFKKFQLFIRRAMKLGSARRAPSCPVVKSSELQLLGPCFETRTFCSSTKPRLPLTRNRRR